LEDDVLGKKGVIRAMKTFALQKTREKEDWFMLDFCQLGFIGNNNLRFHKNSFWIYIIFFLKLNKCFSGKQGNSSGVPIYGG